MEAAAAPCAAAPWAKAVNPSSAPRPMVSTADDGTMTMEPFFRRSSKTMFMARKWRATGVSR